MTVFCVQRACLVSIGGIPVDSKDLQEGPGSEKSPPHLFRHTFATRKIESGADPITVQEIMGEADLKTMLGYVHLRSTKFSAVRTGMRRAGRFDGNSTD